MAAKFKGVVRGSKKDKFYTETKGKFRGYDFEGPGGGRRPK